MNDTDYKKQWRTSQKENVYLHNTNLQLEGAIKYILDVDGVRDLVKAKVAKDKSNPILPNL